MYNTIIGMSVNGLEIIAWSNFDLQTKPVKPFTLIIGGMHGDERAPVPILENFISCFLDTNEITSPVCVIPLLNPDGYKGNIRFNANRVDLNRNFPYNWNKEAMEPSGRAPLSEPESRALFQFIETYMPIVVVNLHWALSEIDVDGEQSVTLAQKMWDTLSKEERKKYRLTIRSLLEEENVKCPGSLGQFCGYGIRYQNTKRPAMITLELPYTDKSNKELHPLPENNFDIMVEIWKKDPVQYLEAVEPSVHKLLKVACESL